MSDEPWVYILQWSRFASRGGYPLPQPIRCLVEVGDLNAEGRFEPRRAHLITDHTDARRPKLEVSLAEADQLRREGLRAASGSSWARPLLQLSPEQLRDLRLEA